MLNCGTVEGFKKNPLNEQIQPLPAWGRGWIFVFGRIVFFLADVFFRGCHAGVQRRYFLKISLNEQIQPLPVWEEVGFLFWADFFSGDVM